MTVRRIVGMATLAVAASLPAAADTAAPDPAGRPAQSTGVTREWPNRIIVERPLRQVVERAWKGSETFRRLCRALADKGAIAVLRPGSKATGFDALTQIGIGPDGIVIGRVMVPLNSETLEYIAHELDHILERAEGVDPARESEREGSGVWRTLDGFETQRAIDTGRQVAREVRESSARSKRP